MKRAIGEMTRRRERQIVYNAERGIIPQTIIKPIRASIEALYEMDYVEVAPMPDAKSKKKRDGSFEDPWTFEPARLRGEIAKTKADMLQAAGELRFEDAAKLRDRLDELQGIELKR